MGGRAHLAFSLATFSPSRASPGSRGRGGSQADGPEDVAGSWELRLPRASGRRRHQPTSRVGGLAYQGLRKRKAPMHHGGPAPVGPPVLMVDWSPPAKTESLKHSNRKPQGQEARNPQEERKETSSPCARAGGHGAWLLLAQETSRDLALGGNLPLRPP